MVNFGINNAIILGLLDFVGAIVYFILTIARIIDVVKQTASPLNAVFKTIFKVCELLLYSIVLFSSGVILISNGWRLDPLLVFQQYLIHLILLVAFWREINQLIRPSR